MKFVCSSCNNFVFDEVMGDIRGEIVPGTGLAEIPREWRCPVCGHSKDSLNAINDQDFASKRKEYERMYPPKTGEIVVKDLPYYRDIARKQLVRICAVNKVCDGNPDRLCMGMKFGRPIGFGGAGQGRTWNANFQALSKVRLRTKLVKEHQEPSMEMIFLGKKIKMPVMVASVSGTSVSMNNVLSEEEFQRGMIEGAKIFGTIGLSGNTADEPDHPGVGIIAGNGGWGIPVFKPQSQDKLIQLFRRAAEANAIAIGVDLDGCGSTNWALRGKPVFRKSERELKELVDATEKPVLFKGIMNMEDAEKVVDSGAKVMGISNHGGRVMDYGLGVAEVLPEIAEKFKGKVLMTADGAVRTGFDVLKVLALGADLALIGRPLARMSLAGGPEAVRMYLDFVQKDLRLAMIMTGCDSIKEISKDVLIVD